MPKTKVFLDSSVIITALLSTSGGSFYILNRLHDDFIFQINEYALAEIHEVIRKKFDGDAQMQTQLFLLLGTAQVQILANPGARLVNMAARRISQNDAPILAAALQHSDYLLTLDNEFLQPSVVEMARKKSLIILKTKDFIEMLRPL